MFGRNLRAAGVRTAQITTGVFRGDKAYSGIERKPGLKDYPPPGARRSDRQTDGSEQE